MADWVRERPWRLLSACLLALVGLGLAIRADFSPALGPRVLALKVVLFGVVLACAELHRQLTVQEEQTDLLAEDLRALRRRVVQLEMRQPRPSVLASRARPHEGGRH
jgi:hypothetical protein